MEYATLLTRDQADYLSPGADVVTERLLRLPKFFVAIRGVDPG